jgi:hypothetical protein
VPEHDLAVAVQALRESDAVRSGQELAQLGAPLVELGAPGVGAIDREEVEGVEESAGVWACECRRAKSATPSSPQTTTSPSMRNRVARRRRAECTIQG